MKKETSIVSHFNSNYVSFRNSELSGRYITFNHIENNLRELEGDIEVREIGRSTLGNPIHSVSIGTGKIKILAWSQMHGNESTTTKAVFDLFNLFRKFKGDPFLTLLKNNLTVRVIPILNPDGALAYTRENANNIDLNRDASNLKEIESNILRKQVDNFEPHFCFNLHDQRTIFAAGATPNPATISFLTPAMTSNREIFPSRIPSMQVIAAIAADLQELLFNQIGRYDDSFNPHCAGDTFQAEEIPTLLFEAGHFPGDYEREETRKYIALALLSGLYNIATGNFENQTIEDYFHIPPNKKVFYDVILRKADVEGDIMDIAIQFKEKLINGEVNFIPKIEEIAPSLAYFGHKEINCDGREVKQESNEPLRENVIVHKVLVKNDVLAINSLNYYK